MVDFAITGLIAAVAGSALAVIECASYRMVQVDEKISIICILFKTFPTAILSLRLNDVITLFSCFHYTEN